MISRPGHIPFQLCQRCSLLEGLRFPSCEIFHWESQSVTFGVGGAVSEGGDAVSVFPGGVGASEGRGREGDAWEAPKQCPLRTESLAFPGSQGPQGCKRVRTFPGGW